MNGKECQLQGEAIKCPTILIPSKIRKTKSGKGVVLQLCNIQANPIPSTDQQMEDLLHLYKDVFDEPKQLPPFQTHDYRIPLLEGTQPIFMKPYRYPHYQKNEMKKLVKEMLASGMIQPSQSPFSSPVVLIWKHDGS